MPITNQIAQFGRGMGAGVTNAFRAGGQDRERQDYRNEVLGMQKTQHRNALAAQGAKAEADKRAAAMEATKGFVQTGFSLMDDPDQLNNAYRGYRQRLQEIGVDTEGDPEQIDRNTLIQLAGKVGVPMPEPEGYDKYYETDDGGLVGIRGNQSEPIDLGGSRLRDKSSKTNVNVNTGSEVGSIPQGWELFTTESGGRSMRPIKGGPVEKEMEETKRKNEERQKNIAMAGGTVIQDIGRGLELLNSSDWAAGPLAGQAAVIPGTPAFKLDQFLNSVASNIGVDRLQAMREASPTGGALGQVPFQQQKRLEQLLGSLDIKQPEPVLKDNMHRIANLYLDTVHGTPDEIKNEYGEDSEEFRRYGQRYELSFDEMGRPKSGKNGQAQGASSTARGGNQALPPTNQRGWTLMTDAQGNKAYVSPDGTQFEEVQ